MAAVLGSPVEEQHFAPEPARVVRVMVRPRQQVAAGDVLVELEAPELEQAAILARLRLQLVDERLARIAGDETDRANLAVLERERAMRLRELEGLRQRRERLVIRAQASGVVSAVARGLAPGTWVGQKQRLVHVAGGQGLVARGVISERDVERLSGTGGGRFVPDDATLGSLPVQLTGVGTAPSHARELKLLASTGGGQVDASIERNGSLHTSAAMFPVTFVAPELPDHVRNWPREIRGVVVAHRERTSIARRMAERVISVALREIGF